MPRSAISVTSAACFLRRHHKVRVLRRLYYYDSAVGQFNLGYDAISPLRKDVQGPALNNYLRAVEIFNAADHPEDMDHQLIHHFIGRRTRHSADTIGRVRDVSRDRLEISKHYREVASGADGCDTCQVRYAGDWYFRDEVPRGLCRGDARHPRVGAGGTLVTLNHRPWDNWDAAKTAPYALEIGQPSLRWRAMDENA